MDKTGGAKAPEASGAGVGEGKDRTSPEIWKAIWPAEPIGLVGPLGTDWHKIRKLLDDRLSTYGYTVHNARDRVGVVYDYTASPVPAFHPLGSAADRYHSGPVRRSTP